MDAFRLCLALGPVAVYVVLVGAINLSRRPLLVTGARDATALGLAVSGFVIVGPMELFLPEAAAARYETFVWVLLLGLYAFCVALALLLTRPRLVIYNISADRLRPILAELVERLDADARWTGDILILPGLGVQLHVDYLMALRNVSLNSVGPHQNHAGWRRLEAALGAALRRVEVARNPRGASFITAGVLISSMLALIIARDPQAVVQALFDLFRPLLDMLRVS